MKKKNNNKITEVELLREYINLAIKTKVAEPGMIYLAVLMENALNRLSKLENKRK